MKVPTKNKMQDEMYQKARNRHHTIMSRCYNKHSNGYKYYGARGVTVCEEWHSFENFYRDLDSIDGWNHDLFIAGELALDKDYKIKGNKEYSKDACTFMSVTENNRVKPHQQKEIIALSPEGVIYEFTNQSDFARANNITLSAIHMCLVGIWRHTGKWQFSFKDSYTEDLFVNPETLERILVGLSPTGETHYFTNASEFAREQGLLEATVIYGCANLKNTHTKGWQFRFLDNLEQKPFLPKESLNIVGKRGIKIKAIDPDGETWYTNNRSAFAREHGLDRHQIKRVLDNKIEDTCGWRFYFE